ncbi:MAG: hypothetical protein KDA32_13325 [Phycisphaerales bacterium]|nr:hypothetical protein [Phycisphaerales bacterium]
MRRGLTATALCVGICATAFGGGHTWDVNEVFSNADGTIQFVELREANGTPGEIGTGGKLVSSDGLAHSFTIASNVVAPTSNRHLLFATQSFADLPGAPTPDQIIPVGLLPFFNTAGDTVRYGAFDAFTFGAVPTDGINSMNDGGIVAANSPTNYAGQTGSVDASGGETGCVGDLDDSGTIDLADLAGLLSAFGASTGDANFIEAADLDNSGTIDLGDLAGLLALFGTPCP